ncbi:MAG TPA: hypothetical protein VGT01_05065, partial [Candidatus Dormibacteraeota bacterium]|nr:hypothetical protein [Candidatus Dormibacteraeota bacterium]
MNRSRYPVVRGFGSLLVAVSVLTIGSACNPFGLPATHALEDGAAGMLSSATSFEITGRYAAGGSVWKVDLQLVLPATRHLVITTSNGESVEAIIIGSKAYFRGREFLAQHLSDNPLGPSLVNAAGNGWWKDQTALVPTLSDFTDGASFRATFLGSAVTNRTDGQDAVELSGPRGDVYVASAPPFRLLRVHLRSGASVDGVQDADLQYANVDKDFNLVAPTDVIDFANLSTLPPIYTVVTIDTSGCASPCAVSAKLKNLGGTAGARAPSTVEFTMSDPVSSSS